MSGEGAHKISSENLRRLRAYGLSPLTERTQQSGPSNGDNVLIDWIFIPEILALSPLDNATNIAINTTLQLTFSPTPHIGTGNLTVVETGVGNFEVIDITDTGQVSISGDVVTVTLSSNLDYNTNYHILLDNNAIAGYSGISSSTYWNFTTIASLQTQNPLFFFAGMV